MNQKEILNAIREEIQPFTKMRYLPEDNNIFLGLYMSELGINGLDVVRLAMNLEKRFGIEQIVLLENVKVREVFDIIVHETYSDEGTAMDSAAVNCCHNIGECAAFKKGWMVAIKWYKENQI